MMFPLPTQSFTLSTVVMYLPGVSLCVHGTSRYECAFFRMCILLAGVVLELAYFLSLFLDIYSFGCRYNKLFSIVIFLSIPCIDLYTVDP